MIMRELPLQKPRVDTGAIRIGRDAGVFIRGDQCAGYIVALRDSIKLLKKEGDNLEVNTLKDLLKIMEQAENDRD
jgi:hypothetical protein